MSRGPSNRQGSSNDNPRFRHGPTNSRLSTTNPQGAISLQTFPQTSSTSRGPQADPYSATIAAQSASTEVPAYRNSQVGGETLYRPAPSNSTTQVTAQRHSASTISDQTSNGRFPGPSQVSSPADTGSAVTSVSRASRESSRSTNKDWSPKKVALCGLCGMVIVGLIGFAGAMVGPHVWPQKPQVCECEPSVLTSSPFTSGLLDTQFATPATSYFTEPKISDSSWTALQTTMKTTWQEGPTRTSDEYHHNIAAAAAAATLDSGQGTRNYGDEYPAINVRKSRHKR